MSWSLREETYLKKKAVVNCVKKSQVQELMVGLANSRSWVTLSKDVPVEWGRQNLSTPGSTTWSRSLLISLPGSISAPVFSATSPSSHCNHTGPTMTGPSLHLLVPHLYDRAPSQSSPKRPFPQPELTCCLPPWT